MNKFFSIVLFFIAIAVQAQELKCTVTINAENTGTPSLQIFKTLETQLEEFISETQWTDMVFANQERIDCNMLIIINSYEGESFSGTIQIQSARPAHGSSYETPIYNYNDQQFSFTYREFEPLNFNPNSFDSNLVSVIAYHVYTVIGLDADSFSLNGGEEYFEIAKQIVNTAASSNFRGWKATDGTQSRFRYNDALLSNIYRDFHTVMYDYHRNGIDLMGTNQKSAKTAIVSAISKLKNINDRRPNSFLLRTFFDAKADEIQSIFSGGPNVNIAQLVENLNKMAPTKRNNWEEIRY